MCHINNKVLLYSIGNYIQHSMISHNGMEKDIFYTHTHTHTHTHTYLNHSAVQQKSTTTL